ncbi:MAG: tetratricopeptide repeat protein [Chloroflexi bacterium]|nr:tetratricopeptide repeat protein [Chloroflexota bacterium]
MSTGLNLNALKRSFGVSRYQADERYRAALNAHGERDLKTAMQEIEASIALLPSHAEYHAALGFFLLESKDLAPAKEAFQRALALQPYEMLANYGLGAIAYRDKDWKRAAAFFSNALAAQPERAETHYYLAMVKHRLGDNQAALDWMKSAEALFAKSEDRRESHCQAWIREFARLI